MNTAPQEPTGARDEIRLSGVRFRACHGVLDYEKTTPQTFIIDLVATLDLQAASHSDDLNDTINYALLTETIQTIVNGKPVNLIEFLAGRIADVVMATFPSIVSVAITVHKPHAPLNEDVADVSVTVHRTRAS